MIARQFFSSPVTIARHETLLSHESLYRLHTADNSFDFTKDKQTVLDASSYNLYTADMNCSPKR
jgi:hypothetical protein